MAAAAGGVAGAGGCRRGVLGSGISAATRGGGEDGEHDQQLQTGSIEDLMRGSVAKNASRPRIHTIAATMSATDCVLMPNSARIIRMSGVLNRAECQRDLQGPCR